ncbi:MAG: aminodeoxychorismate/anthranilate synthase component II [Actinobacteria bacterium]|nr:aminodeoxychorismate/anthranilate synthase component II [Actinomycetota bacterium]
MDRKRVLVIDNYDSFTYNLVQSLGMLGAEIVVFRNDRLDLSDVGRAAPDKIVISPGPKRPAEAGLSKEIILEYGRRTGILGVCLGHQCIGEAYGGLVVRADKVMHGKTSLIHHDGYGVLDGIESPFKGARYHSLVVDQENLPGCLQVTCSTEDNVIMGIRHREYPVEGIQFHPESFMTANGMRILQNFLEKR